MKRETTCDHCGKLYIISNSAWSRHVKHGKKKYCSAECLVHSRGHEYTREEKTCPVCGDVFIAKTENRMYCSLDCYLSDPETKKRLKEMNIKKSNTDIYKCANCGKEIARRKIRSRTKNLFCSEECYHSYISTRFDRNIAEVYTFGEMNNYDEFLSKEKLECPVDGCGWIGDKLCSHMNLVHGIKEYDFKERMGFCRKTGVISTSIHESARRPSNRNPKLNPENLKIKKPYKHRKEAIERVKKTWALRKATKEN